MPSGAWSATHNRNYRRLNARAHGWYVPRALGEETTSTRTMRVQGRRAFCLGLAAVLIAGCGSEPRQDENEEEADYPVEVTVAEFPARQRLAETVDLELAFQNSAQKTSPTSPSPSTRVTRRRTARSTSAPSNRAWPTPTAPSGSSRTTIRRSWRTARARRTSTPRPPPEPSRLRPTPTPSASFRPATTIHTVFRVTPVKGGTYTVHYEVAAGLDGNARATTEDGAPGRGRVRRDDLDQAAAGARDRERRGRPGQVVHRGAGAARSPTVH